MSAVRTPIIDVLKSVHITPQKIDLEIYEEMHTEFTNCANRIGAYDEYVTLFANILFLLTNKLLLDYLLKQLDADVKAMWEREVEYSSARLALHRPKKDVSHFGLLWPYPEPELAENHSNHLLSKVLLKTEQAHGMNLGDLHSAPVPTFVGFVQPSQAKVIVDDRRIWNEEHKLSALFYHGKMTHRIQCYLIMKAVELKLLDLGDLTIPNLIELLTTIKIGNPPRLVWDLILDNVATVHNVIPSNMGRDPVTALESRYAPVVNGREYGYPYLFGCDPYFLHSYLMTVSRVNTPYLSECVTQMFAKSAFAIQRLERKMGKKYDVDQYIRNHQWGTTFRTTELTEPDLQMEEVLKRQAYCFADAGAHFIDSSDITADQIERGKQTAVRDSGVVNVQYRSLISKSKGGSWLQFFKQTAMPVLESVAAAATNIFKP